MITIGCAVKKEIIWNRSWSHSSNEFYTNVRIIFQQMYKTQLDQFCIFIFICWNTSLLCLKSVFIKDCFLYYYKSIFKLMFSNICLIIKSFFAINSANAINIFGILKYIIIIKLILFYWANRKIIPEKYFIILENIIKILLENTEYN